MPAAMTAHVVFRAIDAEAPASTSAIVTREIIRGEIGFDGLLMSDDLAMKALAGDMRARAQRVIAAGSDVALHCNGDLTEMQAAAAGVPALAGRARERFDAALAIAAKAAAVRFGRRRGAPGPVLTAAAGGAEISVNSTLYVQRIGRDVGYRGVRGAGMSAETEP